ncbi:MULTISPECIES: peptidylprolyl isomerase [Jonquetella]|uniref:Parvulin-like peptidyl-prolyl isomerase n=1 Tax=Jonquetella anthropi DSM 22815 TaxID=885272 RepID=H0UJG8_9BACT|nr:peptidylprolyl isomerase [Jonquetella anthropi]EEX49163.1 PPIC-type PPIASE domain protein [Jonquetella anthropi E3_33 E1]EHM13935.1 parvulin-like peptidyl-prolyl isomerase [Jonquetella anthropi DSM 22815]ERL24199.1 PPIC-type PPIASE domain protein [Jonquetella sp. BV3C21]
MRFNRVFLAAITVAATAGIAFAASADNDAKILAKVGPVTITERDMNMAIAAYPAQQRAYIETPQGRAALLDELVNFNLLALSGKEQNLQDTQAFKDAMQLHERQVLANLAGEKAIAGSGDNISDAEIKQYYDAHQDSFFVPESIRASHILISVPKGASDKEVAEAKDKAMDIIKKIKSGSLEFSKAAQDMSSCPSKVQGGDLGFFSKGQMVPAFEKAAFALKPGEMTSEPVRTDFGFHIIKVTDAHPAKTMPLDDVKASIKSTLSSQAKLAAFQKAIAELRQKYPVEILDESLKTPAPASSTSAPAPTSEPVPADAKK